MDIATSRETPPSSILLTAEALTPQRLNPELAYINQKGQRYSYPLWQQLVHHRGQITTLLRQLGAKAVSTDFLLYYDERLERA